MNILLYLSLLCTTKLMAQKTDSLPPHVYRWNDLEVKREEGAIKRPIMKGSTTALVDFEVSSYTLGAKKQQHFSDNERETLIIVKDGQLKLTLNGMTKMIGAGSVAFIIPGDQYVIDNKAGPGTGYYVFKYRSKSPIPSNQAKKIGGSFIINWNDVAVEKTDKGYRRAFFNRPTSQLEKLEMHTTALGAGFDSHAPHTHTEEEIILLLKGNVEMFIAGNLYKAAAGDVVFLSSGVLHALKNTGKEQCEYFAFQWRN